MRNLGSDLVELLLPRACARCGGAAANAALCGTCARAIPRLARHGCRLCQAPLPGSTGTCGPCGHERTPLGQIAAEAAFDAEVAQWVHRFKYPPPGLAGLDPRPGAALGALAADAARRLAAPLPALVVPVPLHHRRLRERGFHPAGELARAVGAALGAEVVPRALATVRPTASQTGLDRAARRRNVAGAFVAQGDLRRAACVVLVDDVVTTGATLTACARALRRGGAKRVVAACAARTL